MKRKLQGKYVTISTVGEIAQAFVPSPLPPNPPIKWTSKLVEKFNQAYHVLGQLDSISSGLQDTSLYLYMYVRKEAVLSSMIEGTQSSISDLLKYELDQAPGIPMADVHEVSNYVAALEHGFKLLEEGLPISSRLIREVHGKLLDGVRGGNQSPGEFRRTQNWIGGTRPGNAAFVPPPAQNVPDCMSKLELFLHDQPEPTQILLKVALAHVQFESIHPFLDGNGRLGRLLITLLLWEDKVLKKPMLYLSLYFKKHRHHYYELLNGVRQTGDWEAWLEYFAEAVIVTATQAVETMQQLIELSRSNHVRIIGRGRWEESALKVHRALMERPIANSAWLAEKTGLTPATVNRTLQHLQELRIVDEITDQRRNRIFRYTRYIKIMDQGTELPDS